MATYTLPDRTGPDHGVRGRGMVTTSAHHGHLWSLRDGTPAHAPPGRLTCDADGRVACHLCGRWFDHLGAHVRRHGWDADRYRDAVGLARHRPLCSATVSAAIGRRQRRRWRDDPTVRAHFAAGQSAARSGELAAAAVAAAAARRLTGVERPEVLDTVGRSLERGRRTSDERRRRHREQVVAAAGCSDLTGYLRQEYADGASLETLARDLRMGREALRRELDAAGVARRRTGVNTVAGKRSRAHGNDVRAARRVGVDDIRSWLTTQRALGVTVADLAASVGRSEPWVRARVAS